MTQTPDLRPDEQSATSPAQTAEAQDPTVQATGTENSTQNGLSVTYMDDPLPLGDDNVSPDEDALEIDPQTTRPDGKATAPKVDAPWISERHSPSDILLPPNVAAFPEPDSTVLQMLCFGVTPELSTLIAAVHPIVAVPVKRRVQAIANYEYLALHRLAGHPIEVAVIRNRKLAKQVSTEAVGVFLRLLAARSTAERLALALDLSRPEVWKGLFSQDWTPTQGARLLGVSVKTLNASIAEQANRKAAQEQLQTVSKPAEKGAAG